MSALLRTVCAACLLSAASMTAAAAPERAPLVFRDAQQEARFQALTRELRCLVCQNQSLADSDADLAADLRRIVFEMMREQRSDEEIIAYLVARYGDFVLYRPPLKPATLALWSLPFLLLAAALLIAWRIARRRAQRSRAALAAEQRERVERLLDDPQAPP